MLATHRIALATAAWLLGWLSGCSGQAAAPAAVAPVSAAAPDRPATPAAAPQPGPAAPQPGPGVAEQRKAAPPARDEPWRVRFQVAVVDGAGRAVPRARVHNLADDDELGETGPDGTLEVAVGWGDTLYAVDRAGHGGVTYCRVPVGRERRVTIQLGPPAGFSGKVVDASGAPIAGAVLALYPGYWESWTVPPYGVLPRPVILPEGYDELPLWRRRCAGARTDPRIDAPPDQVAALLETDAAGTFAIPLRVYHVEYVIACAPGYVPRPGPGLLGRIKGQDGQDNEVTLELHRTVPFRGRVVDAAGKPLAGARVVDEPSRLAHYMTLVDEARSDARGEFTLALDPWLDHDLVVVTPWDTRYNLLRVTAASLTRTASAPGRDPAKPAKTVEPVEIVVPETEPTP